MFILFWSMIAPESHARACRRTAQQLEKTRSTETCVRVQHIMDAMDEPSLGSVQDSYPRRLWGLQGTCVCVCVFVCMCVPFAASLLVLQLKLVMSNQLPVTCMH